MNSYRSDEDLAGMYLSDKKSGQARPVSQHIEAELLLEHYLKHLNGKYTCRSSWLEIENKVNLLSSDMSSTESIVQIILDKQRNNLIMFDLKANLMTVAMTSGTFISSLFGMNLVSSIEKVPGIFYGVAGLSILIAGTLYNRAMKVMKNMRPGRISGKHWMNRNVCEYQAR
jgi:magnesium transporter